MSQTKVIIDIFYDVTSPYSWIGFESLTRYSKVWDVELRYRPIFLAALMKEVGNTSPVFHCPAKALYSVRDVERNNKYWGMNLSSPSDFSGTISSKNTLQAQRMLAAIQIAEPEKLVRTSQEFWMRFFHRNDSIFEQEDFERVAKVVGLKDPASIFTLMKSAEVKKIIRDNTDEAVESGAFGAPWIVVTHLDGRKDCYFGSDRLHLIADSISQPFLGPLKEFASKL